MEPANEQFRVEDTSELSEPDVPIAPEATLQRMASHIKIAEFCLKTDSPELAALHVEKASNYLQPDRAKKVARPLIEQNIIEARMLLTPRETDFIRELATGDSNSEIARRMFVAEQTVKFHLSNIYRKLGIKNRTEAASWALRSGLLGDPEEKEPSTRLIDHLSLTHREGEIMALVARGFTNQEISQREGISEQTAKYHISNILLKLGAKSRTEAAQMYLDPGSEIEIALPKGSPRKGVQKKLLSILDGKIDEAISLKELNELLNSDLTSRAKHGSNASAIISYEPFQKKLEVAGISIEKHWAQDLEEYSHLPFNSRIIIARRIDPESQ
jgi:DNA-binding NarL/FixJ family response regulator